MALDGFGQGLDDIPIWESVLSWSQCLRVICVVPLIVNESIFPKEWIFLGLVSKYMKRSKKKRNPEQSQPCGTPLAGMEFTSSWVEYSYSLSWTCTGIVEPHRPCWIHVRSHGPAFVVVSLRSSSWIPINLAEPHPFVNSASILSDPSPCCGTGTDHVEPGLLLRSPGQSRWAPFIVVKPVLLLLNPCCCHCEPRHCHRKSIIVVEFVSSVWSSSPIFEPVSLWIRFTRVATCLNVRCSPNLSKSSESHCLSSSNQYQSTCWMVNIHTDHVLKMKHLRPHLKPSFQPLLRSSSKPNAPKLLVNATTLSGNGRNEQDCTYVTDCGVLASG